MAHFIQFGDLPPDILPSSRAPENQASGESHDDQSQSPQFQAPAAPGNQGSGESHDGQSQSPPFQAPATPGNQDSGECHDDQSQSPQFQAPAAPGNQDSGESLDDLSQSSSHFQASAEPENQDSGESHYDLSQSSSHFQASAEPENQDSEATHMQPPLFPQLRFFRTYKKPPRRTPRCFSRTAFPPQPLSLSPPVFSRSTVAAPSNWCSDNRLGILGMYLSKDSLLSKMYKRWDLYRTFQLYAQVNVTEDVQYLGTPVDHFLTYPLKPSIKPEGKQVQPPLLEGIPDHLTQDTLPVWATRLLSTRDTLNRHPGPGALPLGGRPFAWSMNSTGTKMCSRTGFLRRGISKLTGFLECPKCGEFWGICYDIERFLVVGVYLARMRSEITENAEQALCQSRFSCTCDGNVNAVRPFISDNFNRINWMCLLLGLNIGFCTVDHLKFFCSKRNLEVSENKNYLLIKVCSDLLDQITVM